jgi:hypothetical protein
MHRPLIYLVSVLVGLVLVTAALQASRNSSGIEYRNTQYGFCFTLPAGWKGYSIQAEQWGDDSSPKGPTVIIRHPRWSPDNPRHDIAIMVFTKVEWRSIQSGEVSVTAAPFPPTELGQNDKYVFALPPRFMNEDLRGYPEVGEILKGKPLHPCR